MKSNKKIDKNLMKIVMKNYSDHIGGLSLVIGMLNYLDNKTKQKKLIDYLLSNYSGKKIWEDYFNNFHENDMEFFKAITSQQESLS